MTSGQITPGQAGFGPSKQRPVGLVSLVLAAVLGGGLWVVAPPVLAEGDAAVAEMDLQLPAGASLRSRRETALGSYALPIGPYSEQGIPQRLAEGRILRRSWQLEGEATVLQVLDLLRSQLVAQGYEILFQCAARQCGGFDFRFGIEVMPAPDMVVSLSDYHFLAAQIPDSPEPQLVSVLVSHSGEASYIQLIELGPPTEPPLAVAGAEQPAPKAPLQLRQQLLQQGHAVLKGMAFNTGAVTLGQGAGPSLERLVAFLTDQPEARILIVGHTDTVGGLADNVALSQRRAASVKEVLVQEYGIEADRIEAAGAGYMAPLASNLTVEGRETNRRVEVVLLSN